MTTRFPCPKCNGTGEPTGEPMLAAGLMQHTYRCPSCRTIFSTEEAFVGNYILDPSYKGQKIEAASVVEIKIGVEGP